MAKIMDMLTYKRPAFGKTEEAFIDKFIGPHSPAQDAFGNLYIKIGTDPVILWSCHTDTVHHEDGRQGVKIDDGIISLSKPKLRKCLGADDGAGVWLMLEMIKANVSGLYIFHRDEESGGRGSSWLAKNHPEHLAGIKFAIALDRKGYDSVITHQGSRTCSDEFAQQLADLLGGEFKPDSTGVFTDTANYTDIIGECTNLSVGYFSQHGPTERQDFNFLIGLRDTLCSTDFSVLEAKREPGEPDLDDWWTRYRTNQYDYNWDQLPATKPVTKSVARIVRDPLVQWVMDHPYMASEIIGSFGMGVKDCDDYADEVYGTSKR